MQCHLVARHYICELCNDILLQGIIYVNYAMPCCLANHHVCELYHAIIFCITCSICRKRLYIQLLFLCISHSARSWKNLETSSSEQTMLSDKEHVLLVTDSSSEEDSETDDQSYFPPRCISNLAGLCCSYHAYGVLHCYVI